MVYDKWEKLGSKVIYENPFIKLHEDTVRRTNGKIAPYYVLEKYQMAVTIPLTDDGYSYLVGQYRYAPRFYSWEFPMGSVEGKKPHEIAQIELKEETGLTAQDWRGIGTFYVAPGILNQKAYVFVARILSTGKATPSSGEFLKVKKAPLAYVHKLINEGVIQDGPTICAYHLLTLHLKQNPKDR